MKYDTTISTEAGSHAATASPIIRDCCATSAACRINLLHSSQVADAIFREVNGKTIVLNVTHCERDDELLPDALCCIAFPYQTSICAFLDCVKNVRDGASALEVHFMMPDALTITNLRRSYRVPIVAAAGVASLVRLADGSCIEGNVLNLSETGVEIELPGDDHRLSVDTEVQFELRFREDVIEVPAVIRRRYQSRRALKFRLLSSSESRRRTAALQRVVRSLEQLWLKSRRV